MTNAGGVKIVEKEPLFPANNITDKEYYYLYAVLEDENVEKNASVYFF